MRRPPHEKATRRSCRVLSPSTASDDRAVKLPLYASTGVAHVWLIDPDLRMVEVFESIGGRPALVATARDAAVVRLAPFDVPLSLGAWWRSRGRVQVGAER